MNINTVQDLIDLLNEVEDKTLPVYIYSQSNADRYQISMVDDTGEDYVDLNISYLP